MFDLDGTLYCETFPIYGKWILFADYVLKTPEYQAPEHIRAVAEELAAIEKASDIPGHMEETHIKAHAEAFAGMTICMTLQALFRPASCAAMVRDGICGRSWMRSCIISKLDIRSANPATSIFGTIWSCLSHTERRLHICPCVKLIISVLLRTRTKSSNFLAISYLRTT
ncbi:MAG: hypothetical protein IJC48_04800 [Clostridia bacterium]|nr:hypothetical protein [Clostridia bacterium]